jgi:hypothetical protein
MLGEQILTVSIQNHKEWNAAVTSLILLIQIAIVSVVHVNHRNHIAALQFIGDALICLKKCVQSVTPNAPIRAEHKENTLMLFCGCVQRGSDLVRAICGFIVNGRLLRVTCAVCGRVGLRAGNATASEEQ